MQIKMRFHLIPVRMAVIKKTTYAGMGKGKRDKGFLYFVGGNVN
jgi:hypothetical protein